jgi:hypothetical protein
LRSIIPEKIKIEEPIKASKTSQNQNLILTCQPEPGALRMCRVQLGTSARPSPKSPKSVIVRGDEQIKPFQLEYEKAWCSGNWAFTKCLSFSQNKKANQAEEMFDTRKHPRREQFKNARRALLLISSQLTRNG